MITIKRSADTNVNGSLAGHSCYHEGENVRAALEECFARRDLTVSRSVAQDWEGNYRDTYRVKSPVASRWAGREWRDVNAVVHIKVETPSEYYSAVKPAHLMWCPTEKRFGI